MNRLDFFVELNGITGTIESYTRDPYIMGYLKVLNNAVDSGNDELEQAVLKKLISWYDNNIDEILSDRYVYNKDLHKTTKSILKDYLVSQTQLCME
jgi:hypothetical protein